MSFGGSLIRPEATGYGLVYFVDEMLKDKSDTLKVNQDPSQPNFMQEVGLNALGRCLG